MFGSEFITNLLVDLVFMFYDGKIFDVAKRLQELGCKDVLATSDGIVLTGLVGGMRVGIPRGLDPINTLVQISFSLFGPYWPFCYNSKEAFRIVRNKWRERIKESKGEK